MKKEFASPDKNEVPEKNDSWGKALKDLGPSGHQKFRIKLTVAGGLPDKSYHLSLQLEKNGGVECSYDSKLDKRKGEGSRKMDEKDVDELVRLIKKTRIVDFIQPPPKFIPDTVVGKLEIYLDDLYHVQYFVADEKQAKHQYVPTHPGLPAVVDWLYGKAAGLLNKRSIKP